MATRKGIHNFETYVVHHKLYSVCLFHAYTLYSKNRKVGQNRISYSF